LQSVSAAKAITPKSTLQDVTVWYSGGRITKIEAAGEEHLTSAARLRSQSGQGGAAPALTLVPGLIDIHTHGADGAQVIDGTTEALEKMAAFYARHGVTGFLAGVFGSQEQIGVGIDCCVDWLERAASEDSERTAGAALLGIYLEGPFLSPQRPGAFAPETIVAPNVEQLAYYIERARGHLRLLTLAPEVKGAENLIDLATRHGIVCAMGHTDATYEEALQAASMGVTHVTHAFNAMRGLHHRDPGAIGAALIDDRFTVEVIADGVHVHPAVVKLLLTKPPSNVILVTDSVPGAGLPSGNYAFRDVDVIVKDGEIRLADGTLAGSSLTMERGIANLVRLCGASVPHAVSMATANPSRLLGLGSNKGQIAPGFDADITALTSEFEVAWTMVNGRIVYQAPWAEV